MKNFLFLLSFLIVISCQSKKSQDKKRVPKAQMSIVNKHKSIATLDVVSKKGIRSWKEYEALEEFLQKFSAISANEVINNAVDLSQLVKELRNSVRPKELLGHSFRARINVLHSEALRLKDMTLIPAITAKEVHQQIDKIIDAFAATSSKINAVYHQIEIKKEINIDDKILLNTEND